MRITLTGNEVFEVYEGEDIHSALKRAGVYITASCGGKGLCGKCKVRVLEGNYEALSYGNLTSRDKNEGIVLACKTLVRGDLYIEIPKQSRLVVGDKIAQAKAQDLRAYLDSYGVQIDPLVKRVFIELSPPTLNDNTADLDRLRIKLKDMGLLPMRFSHGFVSTMAETMRLSNWQFELNYIEEDDHSRQAIFLTSKDYCSRRFGIAVDIGTTTVVVYLVDLNDGRAIDTGSTYNSQIRYGDDVITRIVYATEGCGLEDLRGAVVEDINNIVTTLSERHNIRACEIDSAVIAGNTTMSHLFWGFSPATIREEPYIPTLNRFYLWRASSARLAINPQSPVYTMPCVASYVGGDIVSGVLASKMHRHPELSLFMDIGTNGEIVIGNNEWLMTAACSAGPCFEGSGISSGMRATKGAIEAVTFDPITGEPSLKVIGDVHPIGICGSGMIDALAEMFLTGIVNQKGKFIPERSKRIREGEYGLEYVFYTDSRTGKSITLTEVDIENLMRAKAAIYAGITTLLSEVGLTIDTIERVYIAGGFGNYINVKKAIIIGMLPDIPEVRYTYLGNTSITGAYLGLLSRDLLKEAEQIASKMTYIELSVSAGFMDDYMSALFLPHTDIDRFPTAKELLS